MTQSFRLRGRNGGPDYQFEVTTPFHEGYRLSAAEARAFNAHRAERIQDKIRITAFAEELSAAAENALLSEDAIARVRLAVEAMDKEFRFGERVRVSYNRLGTIEKEAQALAKEEILDEAKRVGIALSAVALATEINKRAKEPRLLDEARERVQRRAELAGQSLGAQL